MIYTTLFLIGLLGLLAQALLGMAGGHGHGGGNAHGHGSHGHGGHGYGSHGPSGQSRGSHGHEAHTPSPGGRMGNYLLQLLSPLTLFSLCLGIGATGIWLRPYHLAAFLAAGLALFGGLLFYGVIVRPVWSLIFKFASTPSRALEGSVAEPAIALSHFDSQGKGLVRLTVDGQLVRVLAYLEPDDRAESGTIQPGDKLLVTSVDARANSCRVARL